MGRGHARTLPSGLATIVAVRNPGAIVGWFVVIVLFVLMTVWAAHESAATTAFVATCLGLLIVVPLLMRTPPRD